MGFYATFNELKVYKYGERVKMEIIDLPNSCLGTRIKWHMKVEFQGSIFLKRISGNYCEKHNLKDMVDIIYLSSSDIVLLPNENPYKQLVSAVVFCISGLLILVWYGVLKKPLFPDRH